MLGRMLLRTPYASGVAGTPTSLEWDGWTCVRFDSFLINRRDIDGGRQTSDSKLFEALRNAGIEFILHY